VGDDVHLVGADARVVCVAAGHGVDHFVGLSSADAVVDVGVWLQIHPDGIRSIRGSTSRH
jgi:hypothetical protein